jgi:hypothetical protein
MTTWETSSLPRAIRSSIRPGSANHNVDTALERANLTTQGNPAINLRGEQPHASRNGLHGAINLQRKLPGWRENERPGGAAHSTLHTFVAQTQQALDGGCCKSNRLSRAGSTAAQNVTTLQGDRNGGCLQSKGRARTEISNGLYDALAQTEVAELQSFGRVCGNRNSFQSVMNNIGALRGPGFRLVAARCARRTLLEGAALAPVSRRGLIRLLVACWAL